jgi:protein-S-isoprenylcysteine O-methyltransferase Ste14
MPELKIERTVANESTETAAAPADFPVPPVDPAAAAPKPEPSRPSWASFRNSLGNICLALLFFVVLIPNKSPHYHSTLATDIWLWGAVLMGVLSLVRVPPRTSMVNIRSILATAAMMITPALMRPGVLVTTGWLARAAIALELVGIVLTQVARIYLGRRFGLLPANRGIASNGPFRWMRHPIYSGWVVLTIGFLMAYPNPRNIALFVLSIPFLIWRISLEEEHLTEDPEYRAYVEKTPWRLFPGIY